MKVKVETLCNWIGPDCDGIHHGFKNENEIEALWDKEANELIIMTEIEGISISYTVYPIDKDGYAEINTNCP